MHPLLENMLPKVSMSITTVLGTSKCEHNHGFGPGSVAMQDLRMKDVTMKTMEKWKNTERPARLIMACS